jgi:hypothetical protein
MSKEILFMSMSQDEVIRLQSKLLANQNCYNAKLFISKQLGIDANSIMLYHKCLRLNDPSQFPTQTNILNYSVSLTKVRASIIIQDEFKQIILTVSNNCSIYALKILVKKETNIKEENQFISHNGRFLKEESHLFELIDSKEESKCIDSQLTTSSSPNTIEFLLFTKKKSNTNREQSKSTICLSSRLSINMDFSFNKIKRVLKHKYDMSAPPFREVKDGLSWICYCKNPLCVLYSKMFTVNKGIA